VLGTSFDVMRGSVRWFMGVPGGFKLNDNLDECLGTMSLFAIDAWERVTNVALSPSNLDHVIVVVCVSGVFGISMMAALIVDLITLTQLHALTLCAIARRYHHLQVSLLGSLWNLFRGFKQNPLRNRVDHCDYSVEQRLLGTLVFTVLIFLFPTTLLYYLFFTLCRSVVVILHVILSAVLHLLNTFPLFAIVLHLVDANNLPGGVWLQLVTGDISKLSCTQPKRKPLIVIKEILSPRSPRDDGASGSGAGFGSDVPKARIAPHTYFFLHNRALEFSSLLSHHMHSLSSFLAHYSIGRVLKVVLLAGTIPERKVSLAHAEADDLDRLPPLVDFWLYLKTVVCAAGDEDGDDGNDDDDKGR
jgi:hypothetical protein